MTNSDEKDATGSSDKSPVDEPTTAPQEPLPREEAEESLRSLVRP